MTLDNFFAPGGLTVAGLLISILLLGSRGYWYYGNSMRDMTKDRDEWKGIAISATATVKQQAEQIAALTEVTESLSKALGTPK